MQDVTILCKVVDNYGDAGVVLRLARALCELQKDLQLRIITDNKKVFRLLENGSSLFCRIFRLPFFLQFFSKKKSIYRSGVSWKLFDWNDEKKITKEFQKNPKSFSIILECFACGRPPALENLLFEKPLDSARVSSEHAEITEKSHTLAHIINIEFLTAENYADEFHKMKSGTRSAFVKKSIFMPGFTVKTGGLILDGMWKTPSFATRKNKKKQQKYFDILLFSYDTNFLPLIKALTAFSAKQKICVHVARGAGFAPFMAAWKKERKPFCVKPMKFLSQKKWDAFLQRCDFLFVRGEDSLSRACLSGVPFVWQAYPQAENYHLVKVDALLSRMQQNFLPEDFEIVSAVWKNFNLESSVNCKNNFNKFDDIISRNAINEQANLILQVLEKSVSEKNSLTKSFKDFSLELFENGNLAEHLYDYLTYSL